MQRGAGVPEKSREKRQPNGVHQQMQQRTKSGQPEQADIQRVDPVQQCVLLDGDSMVIMRLRLENARGPMGIFDDELGIGPGAIEQRFRQGLVFRANGFQFVAAAQVVAGIEDPHVPIRRGLGLREIDEGRNEGKIPNQFRGSAGAQPLPLPVAPMAQPVNSAHRANDHHLGERPETQQGMHQVTPIVPPQRERQDRKQDRHRAQEINGPKTTAVPVAIVDRAGIKHQVGRSQGLDQRQ